MVSGLWPGGGACRELGGRGASPLIVHEELRLRTQASITMDKERTISPTALGHRHIGIAQRYSQNLSRYEARGGLVRFGGDIAPFLAGNEHGRADLARFQFFCVAFDQIVKEHVRGSIAEVGVYRGNTAAVLAGMARKLGVKAYLFDTYEGFDSADLNGIDSESQVRFADTSLASVRQLVGEDNVAFIKGRFPDTVTQLSADESFCLVHVDCDLYSPMKSALEYFYPRLAPGGFLIFHDYSSLHWAGTEKAVDEFFSDKPEPVVPLPDVSGSGVIRRLRDSSTDLTWLFRHRASIVGSDWKDAAHGALSELFGIGWSGPEKWGAWGTGPIHELNLYFLDKNEGGVVLEADVHTVLIGSRSSQAIDVCVGGVILARWNFSRAENRAVRKVQIPPETLRVAVARRAPITLEFRPQAINSPKELDPSTTDSRTLGLGLHRLRLANAQ